MLLDDFPRGVTTRNLSEHQTPLAAIGIADDRHILTVAGSRAGKGVSAIIPNLILYQGSVLAIDPKAELASITARQRAEGLGQQVYVLDPFNRAAPWVEPYKASYNPLSILKGDSPTLVEDAGLIADALVIAGGTDPHWDDSARNFIEGIILHVATYPGYEGRRDLVTVRHLLMNGASIADGEDEARGMAGLQVEMLHNVELFAEDDDEGDGQASRFTSRIGREGVAGALEAAAADFFDKADTERWAVLSTARRHTFSSLT